MNYDKELAFAKELALEAGKIMRRYFLSRDMQATVKSDETLVTLADTEVNTLVINRVKESFPTHSVHGEEEHFIQAGAPFTWVCDPVDGTMPFAKGLPISTFSLGLVDASGLSVIGVAYDPVMERLYYASVGEGAYLNGKKLGVSKHASLRGAYIDEELWINEQEGISFDDPKDTFNKLGAKVTTQCSAVITGCLVAEGQYEAMLFGQNKPEDIAALKVIVEEAGGRVTNLVGKDQRYDKQIYGAIVSNGLVHDELQRVLEGINYKSKVVDQS